MELPGDVDAFLNTCFRVRDLQNPKSWRPTPTRLVHLVWELQGIWNDFLPLPPRILQKSIPPHRRSDLGPSLTCTTMSSAAMNSTTKLNVCSVWSSIGGDEGGHLQVPMVATDILPADAPIMHFKTDIPL